MEREELERKLQRYEEKLAEAKLNLEQGCEAPTTLVASDKSLREAAMLQWSQIVEEREKQIAITKGRLGMA
jgi:hypothetical protein